MLVKFFNFACFASLRVEFGERVERIGAQNRLELGDVAPGQRPDFRVHNLPKVGNLVSPTRIKHRLMAFVQKLLLFNIIQIERAIPPALPPSTQPVAYRQQQPGVPIKASPGAKKSAVFLRYAFALHYLCVS